jgi:hypothetical protein
VHKSRSRPTNSGAMRRSGSTPTVGHQDVKLRTALRSSSARARRRPVDFAGAVRAEAPPGNDQARSPWLPSLSSPMTGTR